VELCPKGLAGPELVHSPHRLQYPVKRTTPKGSPDPGWKRITWDEALDTIATKLNETKAKYGAESVAFTRAGPGGSPMGELWPWIMRLSKAFGSPNNIGTINICTWHTMFGSSYTYANPGVQNASGRAEYERSKCILIWGNNVHATCQHLVPRINEGIKNGAKLIVIDPRKVEIAAMADLWLQLLPGTDGALALGMINVIIEERLYDRGFVRDWTTAPLLIRGDTGQFLTANDLAGGAQTDYVAADAASGDPRPLAPGAEAGFEPAVDAVFEVKMADGSEVQCKTAFRLLRERAAEYDLRRVEAITRVPAAKIREAATMFASIKPACWYGWNGIEQSSNATQTNRAICILYALTGNYDVPGGNVIPRGGGRTRAVDGHWFLSPEASDRAVGLDRLPLGPGGWRMSSTPQGYHVYEAMLTGKPYPVRALLGFGGNLATSNVPVLRGREALLSLDFHAEAELFMTRTAELADIVVPAASCWESTFIRTEVDTVHQRTMVLMRPPVVPPQYESWPDMKIIFELAKRLGMGDKFWDGNYEAGFDYQYSPIGITVEQLKNSPSGIPVKAPPMVYQKYSRKGEDGKLVGFATPSKRVELYAATFKEHGHDPLPGWTEPPVSRLPGVKEQYPLTFMNVKVREYCQSQHRSLVSLRKMVPHPFLEINPVKARELGVADGDWVKVETPYGSITLKARLTDAILYDVVCTQNGWWQACPELNLPGYDPYSSAGANTALLFSAENIDPISGSVLMKGHPCRVSKSEQTR